MPFTLAHPAAVWPLKNVRYLAVIPLVIGSLTPDLVNYLPNAHELINSHSVRGTVILDLPLGYGLQLMLIALRSLLVIPLWQPHRSFISHAFAQFVAIKRWWLLCIPSLLIGSWTHILWDSFTHENRFMVRRLPVLQQVVSLDTDHQLHLYRVLQYGCSVLGVVVVVWWYLYALRLSKLQRDNDQMRRYALSALVVIALIAGLINAFLIPPDWRSVYFFIAVILTTAMAAFAGLYLLLSVVLWQYERKREQRIN